MELELTQEIGSYDEDAESCHVKYIQDGQVMQCTKFPAWCLIRRLDGVHRYVCDLHKRSIYDVYEPDSKLIIKCEVKH